MCMRYIVLAEVFERLSRTSSRLEKTSILAQFLRELSADSVNSVLLLLQGRVFPEWDSRTVGLAGKLVLRAIARATGYTEAEVASSFQEHGDVGLVAQQLVETKKQQTLFSSPLELADVFSTLQHIASQQGDGSQDMKLAELSKLLTSATPVEAKFIVRTVLEDLRVGIATGTLRDGLAYAFFTTRIVYDKEKNALDYDCKDGVDINHTKESIKRALDLTADFSQVTRYLLEGRTLEDLRLRVGTPCKVMLARKERTFSDAFARTGFPVRLEYKYDGFRMQIHKKGNDVKLFTRRLEDVSEQFPDVVAAIRKQVISLHCILDAEVVGYDPQTGKYQPFQHVSKRIKRKYDIEQLSKELPVEVCVFDVLLKGDTVLLDISLPERLAILQGLVTEKERVLVLARGIEVLGEGEAEEFYQKSLQAGNEGIMIKALEGTYVPGGRVSAWIKMKPIMDELDLVIVKAEWGTGKRSKWMTSFTLACRAEDGELYEIGKVGTGMKEDVSSEGVSFPQLTALLEPLVIARVGQEVRVQPQIVIMVAYEEIQRSPTYSSGYALRFPRVLSLRPDRAVSDIASVDDIQDLYEGQ
jgi:DNA ligase 1